MSAHGFDSPLLAFVSNCRVEFQIMLCVVMELYVMSDVSMICECALWLSCTFKMALIDIIKLTNHEIIKGIFYTEI